MKKPKPKRGRGKGMRACCFDLTNDLVERLARYSAETKTAKSPSVRTAIDEFLSARGF